MKKEDLQSIGLFTKPHGYKGKLTLKLHDPQQGIPADQSSLYVLLNGQAVPFAIESASPKKMGFWVVSLEEIQSTAACHDLIDKEVYVPQLEAPLSANSPFDLDWNQLIQFEVHDREKGNVGRVIDVRLIPGNPLLEVAQASGNHLLIPAQPSIVQKIDVEGKKITIAAPPGLIDLFQ